MSWRVPVQLALLSLAAVMAVLTEGKPATVAASSKSTSSPGLRTKGGASTASSSTVLSSSAMLSSTLAVSESSATGVTNSTVPLTTTVTTTSASACLDVPITWKDNQQDGCSAYVDEKLCTHSGGYGPGWNASWGTFEAFAVDGWSAIQACCGCGGGSNSEEVRGPNCVDNPSEWKDRHGDSCATYVAYRWCEDGGVGSSWSPDWGSFDGYASGGISPRDACCGCGGGKKLETEVRCVDDTDWMDISHRSCAAYYRDGLCTSEKGFGPGWSTEWGTFEDYALNGGKPATEACCTCGGGTQKVLNAGPDLNPKDMPRRHTVSGCECKWTWQRELGGSCESSCCNLDNDPLGESCFVKNLSCEGLEWGYCQPPTSILSAKDHCVDHPFWRDSEGDDCSDYYLQQFCTSDGRLGLGWEHGWGNFSQYADARGIDAAEACCACGGGDEASSTERVSSFESARCSNYPPFWSDIDGTKCDGYRSMRLCNAAGGTGPGWMAGMGTFAKYAADNLTATDVCCACGGGLRCEEDSEWVDSAGRSCKVYEAERLCTHGGQQGPHWDHQKPIEAFAKDGLHALEACCACGGGTHSDLEEDDVSEWKVVLGDCQTDDKGCVSSPGYPDNYPANHICAIATPNVGRKAIHVEHFDTEEKFDIFFVNDRAYSGSIQNSPAGVLPKGRMWWTSDASKTASGWKLCPKVRPASGTWHSHDYNCGPGHGGEGIFLMGSLLAGDKAHVTGLSREDCRSLCIETPGCLAVTYTLKEAPSKCYGRKSVDLSKCIFGDTHVTDVFTPKGMSIFGFSTEQVAELQSRGPAGTLFIGIFLVVIAGGIAYLVWKKFNAEDDHPVFTGKKTRYGRDALPSL
mmetsp:Transcript_31441/g.73437  ORF Transcript_31441/g.73437 Transcript_31441/m.73437 type:complete len:857 (+) Transcript_31441:80-2650(+)